MHNLLLLIISCFSGILAGMGMGGGTFLIPALSLIFGISQPVCQATNVICFIVLGFMCFYIYKKNNLIDFRIVLLVSIPACIISAIFTYFSIKITSSVLKMCFAGFLIVFGIFYFVKTIIEIKKNKQKNWC